MKPDEEHCRGALERFLCARFPNATVVLSRGEDPPDYVAQVGASTFNIEVTSLVAKVEVGGRTYNEVGLFAALTKAAEALCTTLESEPWFSGAYAVHLEPVPALKNELPGLTARCLSYARETAHLESAPALSLPFQWSIRKYSNSSCIAGYTLSAAEPSWEGEIREELVFLIRDIVTRKNTLTCDLPGRWLLAVLDRYHVADHSQWVNAAASLSGHHFDAILRVHPHGDCWAISGDLTACDLTPHPSLQRKPPG